MRILLAGGAGYIGLHTASELLNSGDDVIVVDNFCNSCLDSITRVERLSSKKIKTYVFDIKDKNGLRRVFGESNIDCVIHFAGLKAVGESIVEPIKYYRNNIDTTLSLLECMCGFGVKNLVFSSSATVYGEECNMPCAESMKRGNCTNPYGWTKYMIEQILEDIVKAYPEMSVVLLRYFNPVGAHESGLIGEKPNGIPNNLMPYVTQVAAGKRERLTVFGGDYGTPDGTCRRDFIHVMDLANAHLKAVEYAVENKGVEVFNIGTGTPFSVLELIKTFEKVNRVKVNYEIGPRRDGDLPEVWANVDKAAKVLGWRATRSLEDMCRDAWNWQVKNQNGYV